MNYKLIQKFTAEGYENGFEIHVDFQDDTDPVKLSYSDLMDAVKFHSQNIEIIREALLTNNLTTRANFNNLQDDFTATRREFKKLVEALAQARKQYETVQAFFKAQGIKDMSDFPNLNIPQLQGELLEKKSQSEF
jgi:hypothetical protein